MEFVDGVNLRQLIESRRLSPDEALGIITPVCDALQAAHERGIVHRDVKPANVMIETSGRVKLTDFGVARLAEANVDRTVPGTMVGTPSYMSPEQIQGLAVGSRTDLFAAGVVLYEFLTHQKPFAGGGQWTVQRKIVLDDPVWPSMANLAVPPVFDAIVQRALAKDPDDRYPTAAEFAADLRRALGALPPSAVPAGSLALPHFDPDATVLRPSTHAPLATALPLARSGAATFAPGPVPAPKPVTRPISVPVAKAAPVAAAPDPRPFASPAPSGAMSQPDLSATARAPAARSSGPWVWIGGALAATLLLGAMAWFVLPGPDQAPVAASPASAIPLSANPAMKEPPAAAPAVAAPATVAGVREPTASATSAVLPDPPARAPAATLATTPVGTPATPVATPPPRSLAQAKSEARVAAARRPAAAPHARCSDLLQRMQLGESLSPEGSLFFQKECR